MRTIDLVIFIVYLVGIMAFGGSFYRKNKTSLAFTLGNRSIPRWVVLVYGIFINLQNYGIDQNYIQRYLASKSGRDAKRSAFSGGMLYIPVSLMFLFIGTALFAFYRSGAGVLPAELLEINRSDAVFPHFIANELPAGITGLLIASIFAAGMSTISTSYNSTATVLLTDYYKRFFNKSPSERQSMRMLYISSLVISISGTCIAMAMINVKSALDAWWKLASIFSGGMLGLFLLGVFSRKKNTIAAVIGVITGFMVILWLSLSNLLLGPSAIGNQIHTYLTIVLGTSTIFLVGFLGSVFLKKKTVPVILLGLIMLFSACKTSTSPKQNTMDIPKLTSQGENGYISGEFIYPLDDPPTPECHASTVAEIPGGLIAAWFGGRYESNPDVGIWVSRYVDSSWTKPAEVANGIQSDTLRYPCWNPVLFQPVSGPLMLFYKVGPDPRGWWGMLKTSGDGGITWSEASKLGMGPLGHLIGPVKNKPVQLEDGSILCPSSTEVREQGKNDAWMVHFELTKDLGKTWQVIGPINDGIKFDAIQPSILFYRGGKMQILCRTRQGVISQSWSNDQGETWDK